MNLGESKFSTRFGKLIQEATQLEESHGGKFQITSYPPGVGYKSHTDCTLNSEEARDRYATFLVYLNDLGADGGGETTFPGKSFYHTNKIFKILILFDI